MLFPLLPSFLPAPSLPSFSSFPLPHFIFFSILLFPSHSCLEIFCFLHIPIFTSVPSVLFHSFISIIFPVFLTHCLPLLTLSFSQPLPSSLPPSLRPSSRFVLQLCQHSLSRSISFSGSLISCLPSNFTWPGVVWRDGQLPADAFHCPVITSNRILLHKALCFLYWPLFLLSFPPARGSCDFFFLSSLLVFFPLLFLFPPHPVRERERQGKSRDPLLFSPLLSFHSSSPPPLLLSATLNSPSLNQLPGRRDSACSDRFTPHGPSSLSGSPLLTAKIGGAAVQQPMVAESFAKCVTYGPTSKQAQDLNTAVAYFMSKDMMPFQIVEKPGFLHLMKKAMPQYKVPTRNYFSSNKIPAMYKKVRGSVEEKLAEGEWFGATTDLWTSNGGGGEPFMNFTVHYISAEWKLTSHCLETLYFPEEHTAEHIAEMMENMVLDWKIKKRFCLELQQTMPVT
uniref:uncharacterized protein LOC117258104 n=1 Tax=Epinephelus lanceolatus TaxID=310571 RepID=UPI0014472574|nr:uncharacterized protein LOC117258104 [Epinephelus lanceolatus]